MTKEDGLLLAFYGDDFTGSADAMESLSASGYRTVLFLETPTPEMIERFDGIRCIGVAGTSRAKRPADMEQELRPVFRRLAEMKVPIVHYKTCSTFDSSPEVGSIGRAIEVAREYFSGQEVIPLLAGAPPLGRYTLFGHHFANIQHTVYRLDRHPVMSKHPITPMGESDLRIHLGEQTSEYIGLMNILELDGSMDTVRERFKEKLGHPGILLFDVLDDERLSVAGRLIWETAGDRSSFVVGSSGIGYALKSYWQSAGFEPGSHQKPVSVKPSDQVLAVSGSCSMVTRHQIENALEQGFHGIKIPAEQIVKSGSTPRELLDQAISLLQAGYSVIMYTAMGPDDESIAETRKHFNEMGMEDFQSGEHIGGQLGRWMREIVLATGVRRIIIAGGDTSGFVTRQLGVYGLEMMIPVSPGAPLCRAYSTDEKMNGMEVALKGGQLGSPDYFVKVRQASSI
ncbi:four-carbon acid sugar kinase family protein [Paenibacillus piri]|uniref:Four-carbon acid sugar kinase family protein n=1 Tax=Paenibacillus piri TaxID=2547395 RepID=A0A4R5KSB4_9BACL|nr:four-carbon acid sugar kinase family protein [Paenibacillus piri]TDF98743.1 four-carbon acid sugar kinase family protein [Paenibacillus piri]